jgi:Ni,Fe-hydrogenase III large subunit/Ni,Fe-hydrogenase III component G
MISVNSVRIELSDWATVLPERVKRAGWRYGHIAVRRGAQGERLIEALLLNDNEGSLEVVSAPIPVGTQEFPSVTAALPAAHWAERAVGDFWGLYAVGHQRWKSLLLHEAWPRDFFPFADESDGSPAPREAHFMVVGGAGVHEIAVGPIHAGIIEPGHFRFSCIGEIIANLEIRLGYQHRGVEQRLASVPWRHARHVAESASSDSAMANALAHAEAIEGLCEIEVPRRAAAFRTLALEFERLASHLGDLGGLSGDIGFALPAATFGRLRGAALGLCQTLSGSRFGRGFICPGGLAFGVDDQRATALKAELAKLKPMVDEACELFLENQGVMERMEGTGVLPPHLAEEFAMVGPTARASGSRFDARRHFQHALYPGLATNVASEAAGDVLARTLVRRKEVEATFNVAEEVLGDLPEGPLLEPTPDQLPKDSVAVAVVEAWRGSLIHWVTTDADGAIGRYAIRDPSFQNWTGLAIAARRGLVADFPLINKSFGLSYSGNDL